MQDEQTSNNHHQQAGALLRHALTLHQGGEPDQAAQIYQQILQLQPDEPHATHFLGLYLCQTGQYQQGRKLIEQSLVLMPSSLVFLRNFAKIYKDRNTPEKVIPFYQQAIREVGATAEICHDMASIYQALGDEVNYHLNEGVAESLSRKFYIAIEHFKCVIEKQPDKALNYFNLGTAEHNAGLYQAALEHYNRCLEIQPNQYSTIWGRSRLLMMLGEFEKGWEDWQHRWKSKSLEAYYRDFPGKKWQGESGKDLKIFIYIEQGLGDQIQFLRYLPMVAERVGHIYLETAVEMRRLVENMPGITDIVLKNASPPAYDYYIALMDLGYIFKTCLETIPDNIPYLNPLEKMNLLLPMPNKKNSRLKVGVAWRGNPAHKNDIERSIAFEKFSQLFYHESIEFYSLQVDDDRHFAQKSDLLIDLSAMITDFADTACLLKQLDLVICVDTAVGHLAGALGIPTWIMIKKSPDWRWMIDRDDSPWYPSVRLFRQRVFFYWDDIIREINDALLEVVDNSVA